jgi:Fic family protein
MIGFEREAAVYLAKRMLVDSIWKEAMLEMPSITFPTTQQIFDGNVPAGVDVRTVLIVNNLKHAWNYLLDNIDAKSDIMLVSKLNEEIGAGHLIPYAGKIRKFEVGITGTTHKPSIPSFEAVSRGVQEIAERAPSLDVAVDAFCLAVYEQWFLDGNKRTGQLWANHILIKANLGILVPPNDTREKFGKLLIEYYDTGESATLKEFLTEECFVAAPNFNLQEGTSE